MKLQSYVDLLLDSVMEKVPIKEYFERWDELVDRPVEVNIFVILLSTLNSHIV